MTSQLATPVSIDTQFGPVDATHEAFGFTHQADWSGRVQSYRVLGRLDAEGKFTAFPGTEEYVSIEGADLDALLAATPAGKPAGHFRTDDVIAKHHEILARSAQG